MLSDAVSMVEQSLTITCGALMQYFIRNVAHLLRPLFGDVTLIFQ